MLTPNKKPNISHFKINKLRAKGEKIGFTKVKKKNNFSERRREIRSQISIQKRKKQTKRIFFYSKKKTERNIREKNGKR